MPDVSPWLLELYHRELSGDPASTVDALPNLISDGDGASADKDEGSYVDGGDGPPGLTDDDRSNDSGSENEPSGGRVGLPVQWQLDDDVPNETERAGLLPPPGSDYGSGDEVFYGSRGEVFLSHAHRRAGVTALFPVDVDSDGSLAALF
jgi:hypothetical protein